MLMPSDYLDLAHTEHASLFEGTTYVWEALSKIAPYLSTHLKPGNEGTLLGNPFIGDAVFIGKNSIIEEGAMIKGPAWIGEGCHLRKGCYIRENVIVGNGAVVGNATELKNCLLFDEVQVPHFNYVGDSILGFRAHLGAGVILSNVRLDKAPVVLKTTEGFLPTGLKKFGAIIGDHAEIGCHSVLSPGSLIGRHALIYPITSWRGILPEKSIAQHKNPLQVTPHPC